MHLQNPRFAFYSEVTRSTPCVSPGPEVRSDHLRGRFGPYVVEIFDTTAFLTELESAIARLQLTDREVLFVDSCSVRYNKDEVGEYPQVNRDRIYYAQKPSHSDFPLDCEWRVVAALSGPLKEAPEELFLDLTNPSLFCCEMSS